MEVEIAACLKRLDECADEARRYTERCLPLFQQNPKKYDRSEAKFRMVCMVSALQDLCSILYNPAKIAPEACMTVADTFIHGALLGQGGTCSSLPVVYAAVGRRLGYPLRLVTVRAQFADHCFVRWDDPKGERFNFDANNDSMDSKPDYYYRNGRYRGTPECEKAGGFLLSKTPVRELASFLVERGLHWKNFGNYRKAAETLAQASILEPEYPMKLNTLRKCLLDWNDELNKRKPAKFPICWINILTRRYPTLPLPTEQTLVSMEAFENLLNTKEMEDKWWKPMREGQQVMTPPPKEAIVNFLFDRCDIVLRFAN